jgi:hypothetical protein
MPVRRALDARPSLVAGGGMDVEPPPEARIVAIGDPVESAEPLYTGTLHAMLEEAWSHDAAWVAEIVIWTEDRVYGPADIAAMRAANGAA